MDFMTDSHIFELKEHQLSFNSRHYWSAHTSHDLGRIAFTYQLTSHDLGEIVFVHWFEEHKLRSDSHHYWLIE